MKMKIQALYLTGTALLIGAAGVGDSITFDAVGSWTGAVILAVLMAAGGIVCWGYGRGLEIERAEKAQMRRYCRKLKSCQRAAEEKNERELILGVEVENETPADVVMCALHGAVGTARKVMGKGSADPWFAKRMGQRLERELLDQEGLRTTEGVEGKEAKFMAALYGMNAGEQK